MVTTLIIVLGVLLFAAAVAIGLTVMFIDRVLDLFRSPWNRKHWR